MQLVDQLWGGVLYALIRLNGGAFQLFLLHSAIEITDIQPYVAI